MNKYVQENRDLWNKWTPIHVKSDFYDVDGFKAGKITLLKDEIRELGDVSGKSLLHLMCHFGMDTLSWARLGASVTGVDFSEVAIGEARKLAEELHIPASFFCCELGQIPPDLEEQFDIAFTSKGVLAWLPDLSVWADAICRCLRPSGIFYIMEFHPFADILDEESEEPTPRVKYPYFNRKRPLSFEGGVTYADADDAVDLPHHEWPHSISEIVGSLMQAGLEIEFLHEFGYCTYQSHLFLKHCEDGLWRYGDAPGQLPLMFSLRASKPL